MSIPIFTRKKKNSLQSRLFLILIVVTSFIVLAFTALLIIFGINGKEENTLKQYLTSELEHISASVYNDFSHLSLQGIRMSEEISKSCDQYFHEQNLHASALSAYPEHLEYLLSLQIKTLMNYLERNQSGGVFLILDASISERTAPDTLTEDKTTQKSGLFLKTTQAVSAAIEPKMYYLRGPAKIARKNGIELLGQWKMEYDTEEETFYRTVLDTAKNNPEFPLSRLFYWSERVILKDDSEAELLLCVPLRSRDDSVFGICGFVVSDRTFKQLYTPNEGNYNNIFTVVAPVSGAKLLSQQGLIAGNYYLTSTRMDYDLTVQSGKDSVFRFTENGSLSTKRSARFVGMSTNLRVYPDDSPYAAHEWKTAVLMPESVWNNASIGASGYLFLIIGVLLVLCIAISIIIARRSLRPVTKAIDSIKNRTYQDETGSTYQEIEDLFNFLAMQEEEREEMIARLEEESSLAKAESAKVQEDILRLRDRKMEEVDPEEYEHFLKNVNALTPKETKVFRLYLDGHSTKEIIELLGFSESALKFHNKNIYTKLGVSSKKELLKYATLMKHQN